MTERKHKQRLVAALTGLLANKPVHVPDIPDGYKYMDPERVERLERPVGGILNID